MARKVDELGRIVLPVELRRQFTIRAGDELEIAVEGDSILLRKIEARCVFCGSVDHLRLYHEKQVCDSCVNGLGQGSEVVASVGPDSSANVVDPLSRHAELGRHRVHGSPRREAGRPLLA